MTIKQIGVHFEFPNGDRSKPPRVTNDTSEVDVVEAGHTAVEWSAFAISNDQNLTLTGVTFYSDRAKTTVVNPTFLRAGYNYGRYNWIMQIEPGVAVPSEETLYYTLHFKDDEYSNLDWDPTLKVKPRAAGEAAGGAG